MSTPRVAKLSGTITWSDGTLFSGYAIVMLVRPGGSNQYPYLALNPGDPRQRIPDRVVVRIQDGAFSQNEGIFYNADLNPPNSAYVIYYYDVTLSEQLAGPTTSSDFFYATSGSVTPPTYTLPVPSLTLTIPSPESEETITEVIPVTRRISIDYGHALFKTAATSIAIPLLTLPVRGNVDGITLQTVSTFAGTGISALTVTIGDGSTSDFYTDQSYDLTAAPSSTNFQKYDAHKSPTLGSSVVYAHVTANTNFGTGTATVLTGGQVDFVITYSQDPI